MPTTSESKDQNKMNRIQEIHRKWNHASYNELINLYESAPSEFKELLKEDIKIWKEEFGDFCTGCIEGAMKEHAKFKSSKPLVLDIPGNVNVADIMFVENNQDSKKPLYIQVDVCTKYVTGVVMNSRKENECTNAILAVQNDYAIKKIVKWKN